MDDIRVARPHNYRPIAPRRPAAQHAPLQPVYSQPAPPKPADDTQTVSISIGVPQISLKGKKKRVVLIAGAILVIFLIGYAAGNYRATHRTPPVAFAPPSILKHEA